MIKKMWLEYFEATLLSAGVTDKIQINETRKAFYAGAGCVFYGMIQGMDATPWDTEPTQHEEDILNGIKKELDEFLNNPQDSKRN